MPPVPEQLSRTIETLYRSESGRVLASLVRLLGDLDLAEESMHEAFAAALESWTLTGIPAKPRPWLISTARFKAIDAIRRRARFDGAERDLVAHMESRVDHAAPGDALSGDEEIDDDRLRLIFTCCHPALPPEGQVALTLREICGLTTEEIARAFLVPPATLAQRIVRAKAKIREHRFHTRCRRRRNCRSGWALCFRSSISSLTRVTRLRRERRSRGPRSPARRFDWAGC
ncbi:MAG: RNA polymerase sigma factor [Terracidiphilus sp.]